MYDSQQEEQHHENLLRTCDARPVDAKLSGWIQMPLRSQAKLASAGSNGHDADSWQCFVRHR